MGGYLCQLSDWGVISRIYKELKKLSGDGGWRTSLRPWEVEASGDQPGPQRSRTARATQRDLISKTNTHTQKEYCSSISLSDFKILKWNWNILLCRQWMEILYTVTTDEIYTHLSFIRHWYICKIAANVKNVFQLCRNTNFNKRYTLLDTTKKHPKTSEIQDYL